MKALQTSTVKNPKMQYIIIVWCIFQNGTNNYHIWYLVISKKIDIKNKTLDDISKMISVSIFHFCINYF